MKYINNININFFLVTTILAITLGGCGTTKAPTKTPSSPPPSEINYYPNNHASEQGREIALFSLQLMDTKYTFGGKNPSAGLDCSGLVSYVFKSAINYKLEGSAATQAQSGKKVSRAKLAPGDLIFFNTTGKPYSHVGIYIGDNRFIHAPNSHGTVRLQELDNLYWGRKVIEYRSYVN